MTTKASVHLGYPKHWNLLPPPKPVTTKLARKLGVSALFDPVVSRLVSLGHLEPTLSGGLESLEDDSAFDNQPGWELSKAALRVREASLAKGKVYLHGDSDTDGITATLVVERALAHYFPAENILVDMPDPLDHYGFGMKRAQRALDFGANIIITMDCGTNNTSEVAFVAKAGATVIVLDHHELDAAAPYPEALVINGKVLHKSKNLEHLSSGGLAWRFSAAVHKAFKTKLSQTDHGASLAYVALSTVVDVVPLVGDNRILVREGLTYLNDKAYATPALVALRDLAKCPYNRTTLQSFDLGFRIGPLLNLGKRLPSVTPQQIYDLLARETKPEKIESEMVRFGLARQERREQTAQFKDAALRFVESRKQEDALVKLAVVRNCPRGIVGLVAQNVASHYKKPAIVLTDDPSEAELPEEKREWWYGSGRCPLDLDFLGMVNATGLAVGHGHRQAVGGIRLKRVDLPAFKEAIWKAAIALSEVETTLFAGRVDVVASVPLSTWTASLAKELSTLVQPTGQGNPPPLFAAGPYACVEVRDGGNYAVYSLSDGTDESEVRRLGQGSADPNLVGKDVYVLYEVQLFNGSASLLAREFALT